MARSPICRAPNSSMSSRRGDVEYIFKHALTQEVAYNSLLIEHRKLLHEQIALSNGVVVR